MIQKVHSMKTYRLSAYDLFVSYYIKKKPYKYLSVFDALQHLAAKFFTITLRIKFGLSLEFITLYALCEREQQFSIFF